MQGTAREEASKVSLDLLTVPARDYCQAILTLLGTYSCEGRKPGLGQRYSSPRRAIVQAIGCLQRQTAYKEHHHASRHLLPPANPSFDRPCVFRVLPLWPFSPCPLSMLHWAQQLSPRTPIRSKSISVMASYSFCKVPDSFARSGCMERSPLPLRR